MKEWGKVVCKSGQWCVRGKWQGKRRMFSKIPTAWGDLVRVESKEQAEFLQAEISKEVESGTFNPDRYQVQKPSRVRNYFQKWLDEEEAEPTIKWNTFRGYRTHIQQWIIPLLGDIYLTDLNHSHFKMIWKKTPKSRKYRKNILTTMYAVLEDAKREGAIPAVPEKIVFKGKYAMPLKDPEWIEKETQNKILEHIKPEDMPIFQFMQISGVRPSEARALHKSDLHYDKGYISIRHTFAPVASGGEGVEEVKQKKERRIPFYDSLKPILEAMPANLTPFVFINPRTGNPYSKNINRDIWNPACKKAKVNIKLNNAGRHSWGNQLSASGMDIESISKGLGHSTTKTTKTFYANPNLEKLKKAVDNVQDIKNGTSPGLKRNGKQ